MVAMTNNNNGHQRFGDTTLTKVFVGGLAWETPLETMREHFEKYGHILEAVIISDKLTGKSKGYGFVTYKDAESAQKACDDPTPVIKGRRANCNLASLGAHRDKPPPSTTTTTSPPQGYNNIGARTAITPPTNYVQWYYPTGAPPQAAAAAAPPLVHHRRHQAVPFYGYSPVYSPTSLNYNPKLNYTGGANIMYPGQPVVGPNLMLPAYHFYQFNHPMVGLPAHMYSVSPITTDPAHISKPKLVAPQSGTVGIGKQ